MRVLCTDGRTLLPGGVLPAVYLRSTACVFNKGLEEGGNLAEDADMR